MNKDWLSMNYSRNRDKNNYFIITLKAVISTIMSPPRYGLLAFLIFNYYDWIIIEKKAKQQLDNIINMMNKEFM